MSKKKPEKHTWVDRDGRKRTDNWHPARKSEGLLPLLSLTMHSSRSAAPWEEQKQADFFRINSEDPDEGKRELSTARESGAEQASAFPQLPEKQHEQRLPQVEPESTDTKDYDSVQRMPSLYYREHDDEEDDRSARQPLIKLSDRPCGMQQFLEFRQEEKRRRIGAIESGEFGERTAQMLREVFCPATPDPAIKTRTKLSDLQKNTTTIMSHESLLYEHFKKYSHVQSADMRDGGFSRSSSLDDYGIRAQEGSVDEVEKQPMDLRGFIAFMKGVGLIPKQIVQEGNKSALPIQYSLAVQAFKMRQAEIGPHDIFGFPDFKDSIYKFFYHGKQLLQDQIDQRLQKIEKLESKIARQVPNSPDPIQALKQYFSELFDSIFDAYIYFDNAGDWQVTMSGFRQQCKKLGLPLTEADLYAALLNKTQMSFIDQDTFIHTFGWYPLVVKPKLQVDLYRVKPVEASLHRMFCLMSDGVRAEDALAEVKRVEEEKRLKDSSTRRRVSSTSESETSARFLFADNKNFVGKWKRGSSISKSPDGGRSPVYAIYAQGEGSPRRDLTPTRSMRHSPSSGMLPSPVGSMRASMSADGNDTSPRGSRRGVSSSPVKLKISSSYDNLPGIADERRDVVSPLQSKTEPPQPPVPAGADPDAAIDSADHAMAFQTFVEFMKVIGLVPIAEPSKGKEKETEKEQRAEKEAGHKTDLGSAEFETALEIFRETTGKGDRLEWQEFKDCLHGFLRTGLRRLHSRKSEQENELYKMRVRMSKFAPSSDNPLAAFKDVLSVRFDTIYDAFVYFDLSGDWQLTKAEVKNMMRRLLSPLTTVDVDAALNQVFLTSGNSINALDFVRKLKWTKDLAKKVLEDYKIAADEKELHQEFLQFSRKSHEDHHDDQRSDSTQRDLFAREASVGSQGFSQASSAASQDSERGPVRTESGSLLQGMHKKRLSKEEIARKKQEAEARLPEVGFIDLAICAGIVRLKNTTQVELAHKAFQLVNWADDKDNEISWPEFKHVLYMYFKTGPTMLQPLLDTKRQELRMKRLELYQRVKTQTDSIKAMRESLADRFESVFDAFCYFDVAGDGHVSLNDMKNMLPKLRMAMTVADLHAAILKIMKVKDKETKADVFVDPMEFSKTLAWHAKPKAGPGLRRALDASKGRRAMIVEKAHAKAEAAPAPIPTDPDILPDDAQVVDRLQKQIDEVVNLQQELRRTTDVYGMPIESSLALPDAEIARRKELAQQDLRERALKASDRGITELLERAAKNKMRVQETAQQRSQDDDYARKMLGLKDGAREPPKVETLMQWAPKTEKLELRLQQEKLNRVNMAIQRLSVVKEVIGVPINELAISTKDRYRKQEIDIHNREVKRIAVQGIHTMVIDGLEKAKLRRKEIVTLARNRAEKLRPEWAEVPFPSESVQQAFGWFSEMARKRLDQEKRVHTVLTQNQNTDPSRTKGSLSPRPAKKQHQVLHRDRGPMNPDRIKAAAGPMTKALRHRFANIYDAWAYFDADGSWEILKSEFRKRSQGLRLSDESVDVEAVLRAVDGDGSEKVNPHDFVRVLKWHEMPGSLQELRNAFDSAAKRRAVVSEVAIRRSKMTEDSREHALSAEDEVATEFQRAQMERMKAQEGMREKRQRRLKEMAGPPRLFVDWAVQQDLNDLQQLRYELEVHRDAVAALDDGAAHDIKGLPVEELSFKYHTLATDMYEIDPEERTDAANKIKAALRKYRKNRLKQGIRLGSPNGRSVGSVNDSSTRGGASERDITSSSSRRARWAGIEDDDRTASGELDGSQRGPGRHAA